MRVVAHPGNSVCSNSMLEKRIAHTIFSAIDLSGEATLAAFASSSLG
jgi:hypothetical protein